MRVEAPTAPEWRHVVRRFAGFLHDLEPGAEATAAAAAARADVEALLRPWLRPVTGKAAAGRFTAGRDAPLTRLIGGHAHGTALKGTTTVDLLLMLGDDERQPRANRRRRDGGRPIMQRLPEILRQRYGVAEIDRNGWISIRTDCHPGAPWLWTDAVRVRLMPAFRCAAGGVLLATAPSASLAALSAPLTTATWQHLDADAQRQSLDYVDRLSHGKARHLVRLVKAWRDAARVSLSGFAIELLVGEFLLVWLYRRRSLLFYDWMVRDFFFWLSHQGGRTLPVPGTIDALPIGEHGAAAAQAHALARAGADLERDNNSVAAGQCWEKLFGLGIRRRQQPQPLLSLPAASGHAAVGVAALAQPEAV